MTTGVELYVGRASLDPEMPGQFRISGAGCHLAGMPGTGKNHYSI